MPPARFATVLTALSGAAALLLLLVHQWEALAPYAGFSWTALGFFVLLTLLIYLWARMSARHPNPNLLLQIAMVITLVKVAACVALVYAYVQREAPPTRWFLLPFFGLYLLYTIFETYVLMQFSQLTPKDLK